MNNISPSHTKKCLFCGKVYEKPYTQSKKDFIERSKYCSLKCKNQSLLGSKPWNYGIKVDREKYPHMGHFQKHTKDVLLKITQINRINAKKKTKEFYREIQKKAIALGLKNHSYKGRPGIIGSKHESWRGNDAGYSSKHKWILKYWKKTGICQKCGIKPKPYGRIKNPTQWHSIEKEYDRDNRNNWVELCPKCHKQADLYGYKKMGYSPASRKPGESKNKV